MRLALALLLAAAPAAAQQHGTWEPGVGAGGSGVDTTCLDAGVECPFADAATEGGPATTALALAADPDDCDPGEWSGGISATGAAQGCTEDDDVPESGDFAAALALEADGSLSADTVGLGQLAACPGPAQLVEYGASGVPSCIATPGGGGTPGGSDAQVQYNDAGAFGGMTGVLWDDATEELTIRGRTDSAAERVAIVSGPDRATPAVSDAAYLSLVSDSSGGFNEVGRIQWITNGAGGGSASARIEFLINQSGVMTNAFTISSWGLSVPAVSAPAGASSAPAFNFGLAGGGNGENEGCWWVSNGVVACVANGVESFRWQQGLFVVPSSGLLNFSTDTGLARDGAAGRLRVTNASTGTGSILYGAEIASPAARTCTDSGDAGPGTLASSASGATYLAVTNSDPDGCDLSISETGAVSGQRVEVVVVSNAGGAVALTDVSSVREMAGDFSMGAWDAITFRYATDRWVEVSRSDN